jgi:transcriptional regulator GlxA family with amidase domain
VRYQEANEGRARQTTGRAILQVAADAGYESQAASSRAFRRVLGLPPAQYRRRRTGNSRA